MALSTHTGHLIAEMESSKAGHADKLRLPARAGSAKWPPKGYDMSADLLAQLFTPFELNLINAGDAWLTIAS